MSALSAKPDQILHLTARADWDAVAADPSASYRAESLAAEGFIHCSTVDQLLIPANERFAGRQDLVVLVIDVDKVPSRTVYEDCYESGLEFPHVYGPIPVDAVTEVVPFPCRPDGSFQLPDRLC